MEENKNKIVPEETSPAGQQPPPQAAETAQQEHQQSQISANDSQGGGATPPQKQPAQQEESTPQQNNDKKEAKPQGGEHLATQKPSVKKMIIAAVVSVAVLACLAMGSAFAIGLFNDTIYPGVTFLEQDLGGMTLEQAEKAIDTALSQLQFQENLTIVINEQEYLLNTHIDKTQLSASDIAKSAYEIGREGNAFTRAKTILDTKNGVVLGVPFEVDEGLIQGEIGQIANIAIEESKEKPYRIEDDKLYFDRTAGNAFIDVEELTSQAAAQIKTLNFTPLEYEVKVKTIDGSFAEQIAQMVNQEPKEPTLDLEADKNGGVIISGQVGVELDVEATAQLLENSTDALIELPATITRPKHTDEEYKALLFRDELSSQTTKFNPNLTGRTKNVGLAAGFCEMILLPGQEFSYAERIGRTTAAKGYQPATIFVGGETEEGIGGGVCQVSSTLYMAAMYADLEISRRQNHSLLVVYTPIGQDATYSTGGYDFRFVNNTGYPIKIKNVMGGSTLTCKIIGTNTQPNKTIKIETVVHSKVPFETVEVYDSSLKPGQRVVKNDGYPAVKASTYRIVYIDGKEVSRTLEAKSSYKQLNKTIAVGTDPNAKPVGPTTPPIETPPVTDPTTPPVDPTNPTTPPADNPSTTNPNTPPAETNPPVDPTTPPDNTGGAGQNTQIPPAE